MYKISIVYCGVEILTRSMPKVVALADLEVFRKHGFDASLMEVKSI